MEGKRVRIRLEREMPRQSSLPLTRRNWLATWLRETTANGGLIDEQMWRVHASA
jgi:hypothetical protein